MYFERPFKMHKIIFFFQKKYACLPLGKIFRFVTRNTLIFLFGLTTRQNTRCEIDGTRTP